MLINDPIIISLLFIAFFITILLFYLIIKKIKKSQLKFIFLCVLTCLLVCLTGLIAQILLSKKLNIEPIYFEYIVYIGNCFLPIALLFFSIAFANTKVNFKRIYFALFMIPIISLLMLWTNDYHHLFYRNYSLYINETQYGPFLIVHTVYSYILLFSAILTLIRYSIKNAGFFSKQSLLITLGCLVPIVVNVLGTFKFFSLTIYITNICFTISILFIALAIFKFKFLSITPIALQRIVDRISDGYIVLDEEKLITNFNKSFLTTFKLKEQDLRNMTISDLDKKRHIPSLLSKLNNSIKNSTMASFETKVSNIDKYFNVEISSIKNNDTFLGTLILFKDITQHIHDIEIIKSNQGILMERERLASLGQLIGGIAHNLKTPIMSISGATEGLTDLINEYDTSIEDPEVNYSDHHEIAGDMREWIKKIRSYLEYMSDIITAVKGQAVAMNAQETVEFTIDELIKRVNILMKHELKNAIIYLNVQMKVDSNLVMHGEINGLVQVINNMISNAIQAYNGKTEQNIDMIINKKGKNLIISIKDYAGGIPENVKDKLFKEMITTKGKNGTGLGMYMSYSNIRAYFKGDITYESIDGVGTTFNIILPMK